MSKFEIIQRVWIGLHPYLRYMKENFHTSWLFICYPSWSSYLCFPLEGNLLNSVKNKGSISVAETNNGSLYWLGRRLETTLFQSRWSELLVFVLIVTRNLHAHGRQTSLMVSLEQRNGREVWIKYHEFSLKKILFIYICMY